MKYLLFILLLSLSFACTKKMRAPFTASLPVGLVGNGIEFPMFDTMYMYYDSGWGSEVGVSGDTGFVKRIFRIWDSIALARKHDSIVNSLIFKNEGIGKHSGVATLPGGLTGEAVEIGPLATIAYSSGYRKVIPDSLFIKIRKKR
jgi:hypothetical protein